MISWGHDRDNKRTSADEHCDFKPDIPDWASRLQPVEYRRTSRSPGFSRWNTCRGRSSFRASRLQPVEYRRTSRSPGFSRWNICRGRSLLPGKPDPAKAGTPVGRRSGVPALAGGMSAGAAPTSGSPGFSRWNTCRDGAYCPASLVRLKPGLRAHGVPALAGGMPKNIRESRRQPVEYLPGAQPTARQAWSG
jgi:hypothetical protein